MARSRGRGGRSAAALTLLALAFVALAVTGCDLLLSGAGAGFGEPFPSSSPIATFTSGSATIEIDGGEQVQLTAVGDGSGIDSMLGSDVRWSNADGWNLSVGGAGAKPPGLPPGFGDPPAYLTLDRITSGQHWTIIDPTRCIVDVAHADATGLRGTAICKGLKWYDALGTDAAPPKPVDEPKFDADITFEALP